MLEDRIWTNWLAFLIRPRIIYGVKTPFIKFRTVSAYIFPYTYRPPIVPLTLPMLRLPSYKKQGRKDVWKPSKPCHVGIYWIALTGYSQMNTHVPGFQSFPRLFLHHFVLATSSIRVKHILKPISIHFAWNDIYYFGITVEPHLS